MRRPSPNRDGPSPESAVARRHRDPVAATQCGAADVPASGNGRRAHIQTLGSRCRRLTAGLLLAVVVAACGDGGTAIPTLSFVPSFSSVPSLGQAWVGWFASLSGGTRTATMTLFQVGPALTGFWTIFEAEGPASGDLTGTIVGSTALLTLRPYAPDACTTSVVALVRSMRLEGTWSRRDCGTEEVGTFILNGQ